MHKKFLDEVKTMSTGEKWLVGISLGILINYQFAIVAALIIVGFYVFRFGKKLLAD